MDIELIAVPYDSGRLEERMGRGPGRLLEAGLADALREGGRAVDLTRIRVEAEFPTEGTMLFRLAAAISGRVSVARGAGRFPLVLAGNCASALGTVAGLDAELAAVWLDSHGDLHTPETTASGFLDGTALAAITGRCWAAAAAGVPGFTPVPEARVLLVGARDLDPAEQELVDASPVTLLAPAAVRGAPGRSAVGRLLERMSDATAAYVHVDLDVLDPGVARANGFAAPDGLDVDDVVRVIDAVAERLPLGAAAITAYDPAFDDEGRAADAAIRIAVALAERAA